MDKHRALIEGPHALKLEDFLPALFIHPFRNMHDERQVGRAGCEFARQLWLQWKRMCPAKV